MTEMNAQIRIILREISKAERQMEQAIYQLYDLGFGEKVKDWRDILWNLTEEMTDEIMELIEKRR